MFTLIQQPVTEPDEALPLVRLRTDRRTLAKRIWRARADDGQEFGFDLREPLKPGATILQTPHWRYIVDQEPEALLEIALDISPSAAAGIGWAVGNLHLELSAEASRLLAPDEPAVRQLFTRLDVPFRTTMAIFRPGRFVRSQQTSHELGASHRHS